MRTTKNNKKCKGCGHRRPLDSAGRQTACHYSLDTGKLRGCRVEERQHYTKKKCVTFDKWHMTSD